MRTRLLELDPLEAPVSTEDAKAYARVEGAAEDDLVTALVLAVAGQAERLCERAFLERAFELTVYGPAEKSPWDDGLVIRLPRAPLVAVESASFYDADDAETELDEGDDFRLDGDDVVVTRYARLGPGERIALAFTAGYAETAEALEAAQPGLRLDLLRAVATAYEHREDVVVGPAVGRLPGVVTAPFRTYQRVRV